MHTEAGRKLLQQASKPSLPSPPVDWFTMQCVAHSGLLQVDKALLSQLLVHRIPPGVTWQQLQAALQEAAGRKAPSFQQLQQPPSSQQDDPAEQDSGSEPEQQQQQQHNEVVGSKQVLVFKHPGDMEAFFQALPRAVTADSVGRRTKQLQVAGSKVRRNRIAGHREFGCTQVWEQQGHGCLLISGGRHGVTTRCRCSRSCERCERLATHA